MFHLIFNIHHSWERWFFQSNKKKFLLCGQWLKISIWRCLVLHHTCYCSYVGYVITFYFFERIKCKYFGKLFTEKLLLSWKWVSEKIYLLGSHFFKCKTITSLEIHHYLWVFNRRFCGSTKSVKMVYVFWEKNEETLM